MALKRAHGPYYHIGLIVAHGAYIYICTLLVFTSKIR